jgi:hypothetical protein
MSESANTTSTMNGMFKKVTTKGKPMAKKTKPKKSTSSKKGCK